MRCIVDSRHSNDKLTRRSLTGYFISMNMIQIARRWIHKTGLDLYVRGSGRGKEREDQSDQGNGGNKLHCSG